MKWTVLIPWTDDHISEEDIVEALQTHIDPDVVDGIFDRYKDLINSNTPFDDFIFELLEPYKDAIEKAICKEQEVHIYNFGPSPYDCYDLLEDRIVESNETQVSVRLDMVESYLDKLCQADDDEFVTLYGIRYNYN